MNSVSLDVIFFFGCDFSGGECVLLFHSVSFSRNFGDPWPSTYSSVLLWLTVGPSAPMRVSVHLARQAGAEWRNLAALSGTRKRPVQEVCVVSLRSPSTVVALGDQGTSWLFRPQFLPVFSLDPLLFL